MKDMLSKILVVKTLAYLMIGLAIALIIVAFIGLDRNKQVQINLEGKKLNKVSVFNTEHIKNIHAYENLDNNIIAIDISFKGGGALDPIGYEGLSYFLSLVLMQGNSGLSPYEFNKLLDDYSIKLSVTSGRDFFNIHITTLTYYRQKAFDVLSMIINASDFSPSTIDLVKNDVRSSLALQKDDNKFLLNKALRNNLFRGHKYYRDSIGNTNALLKFNAKDVKDFKQKLFTKDNLYLSVSGNINNAEITKVLDPIFMNLPDGNAKFLSLKKISPKITRKIIDIPYYNAKQSDITMVLNLPFADNTSLAYFNVINAYLGGIPDSVLFNDLRNKNGLVYFVSSGIYNDNLSKFWLINLGSDPSQSKEAIARVQNLLKDLKAGSYNFNDIIIARNWLINNSLKVFTSNDYFSSFLTDLQLENKTIEEYLNEEKLISNISEDNIKDIINKLDVENVLTLRIVPKK